MSIRRILHMGLLAAALVGGAVAHAAEPAPVVRVVFNTAPNPPIVYGTGTAIDPDKPSLIVELLRMVGDRTGITFEFQRVPWQRGLYMIEHGQADAIFAASVTEDRFRYGAYPMKAGIVDESRSIYQMSYSLFVRRGSGVHWNGHQISGLRAPVGAIPEFAVVPALREMGVALDLEPSAVGNLLKLDGGRIDAYAEIETLANAAIRANPSKFANIEKLSPPLRTTPYYLMFSKIFYQADPEIAERVWDGIAAVRASAAYQSLLTGKYGD